MLSLKLENGKQSTFAIYSMDSCYHYRYLFNKEQQSLHHVPLDDYGDIACIEVCTLLLEILEEIER